MRWFVLLLVSVLFLCGCGAAGFKVTPKEYREQVRTLGVLHPLVDDSKPLPLPEGEAIRDAVRQASAGKQERLVEALRQSRVYFDVRSVTGQGDLFDHLVKSATFEGQGEKRLRRYGFNAAAVSELARRESVDALLVIILYDQTRAEKRWSRSGFDYLEAEYTSLFAAAQVVDRSGRILWELDMPLALLPLQYPDFDDAFFNRTDEVRIIPLSPQGVSRNLARPAKTLSDEEAFPEIFLGLFHRIRSELTPGKFWFGGF